MRLVYAESLFATGDIGAARAAIDEAARVVERRAAEEARGAAEKARGKAEQESANLELAQARLWLSRDPTVAAAWLKRVQQPCGGWGETCRSYNDPRLAGQGEPTASQTAWALLGLLAAGEADSPEVAAGIDALIQTQGPDGNWEEEQFTGTGFPKVFYLKYHLYRLYFPLMALGQYAAQLR